MQQPTNATTNQSNSQRTNHPKLVSPQAPTGGGMQIFAKTLTGDQVTVEVASGDTLQAIKDKMQDQGGIDPAKRDSISAGKLVGADHRWSAG